MFKRIAALLALCLAALPSMAQTWHADPISGCTVYDSESEVTGVVVSWIGACDKNNRATGSGVLDWFEGGQLVGRYEGPMQGGKAEGHGVLHVLAEAGGYDRYSAFFKGGDIIGPATATSVNGTAFEGTLDSRSFSGNGIFTTADGDQYTGDFKDSRIAGNGHLLLGNGEQMRGEFVDGELHGEGEWLGSDGDYFKGGFVDSVFSGKGRYETASGELYEGEFANGLPEGEGRFTDAEGRVTAGEFKAGWPEGQVDITTPDGKTISEFWSDGEKETL